MAKLSARLFPRGWVESKLAHRHPVANHVNPVGSIIVEIDDFVFDHLGVCDHAFRAPIIEQEFFEMQDIRMLSVEAPGQPLPRILQRGPALQPGSVHAIARPVNITGANPLQAHQHVRFDRAPQCFELFRESQRGARP